MHFFRQMDSQKYFPCSVFWEKIHWITIMHLWTSNSQVDHTRQFMENHLWSCLFRDSVSEMWQIMNYPWNSHVSWIFMHESSVIHPLKFMFYNDVTLVTWFSSHLFNKMLLCRKCNYYRIYGPFFKYCMYNINSI